MFSLVKSKEQKRILSLLLYLLFGFSGSAYAQSNLQTQKTLRNIDARFSQMAASGFWKVSKEEFENLVYIRRVFCEKNREECEKSKEWIRFACAPVNDQEQEKIKVWLSEYFKVFRSAENLQSFTDYFFKNIPVEKGCFELVWKELLLKSHKESWQSVFDNILEFSFKISQLPMTEESKAKKELVRWVGDFFELFPLHITSPYNESVMIEKMARATLEDQEILKKNPNLSLQAAVYLNFYRVESEFVFEKLESFRSLWLSLPENQIKVDLLNQVCHAARVTQRKEICGKIFKESGLSQHPEGRKEFVLNQMANRLNFGEGESWESIFKMARLPMGQACSSSASDAPWKYFYAAQFYATQGSLKHMASCLSSFLSLSQNAPIYTIFYNLERARRMRLQGHLQESEELVDSSVQMAQKAYGKEGLLKVLAEIDKAKIFALSKKLSEFSALDKFIQQLAERNKDRYFELVMNDIKTILLGEETTAVEKLNLSEENQDVQELKALKKKYASKK